MTKAVAKRVEEETAVAQAPVSETAAIIQMIERAARDPNVDIDKMERLFQMRLNMEARAAKTAYLTALAKMQPLLPIVGKKGVIERNAKDDKGDAAGKKKQRYARWEDINEAIVPVMAAHGFSLTHRIEQPSADRLSVTAVLGHCEGHSEQTSIALPFDASGGKNNMHGWGSAASYGKRYTSIALLNITARGEDDDAKAAGAPETITEDQAADLSKLMAKAGIEEQIIFEHFKVAALTDMTPAQLETATNKLNKKLVLSA